MISYCYKSARVKSCFLKNMYKKYSLEFSKIYKRLMELEIVIKQNLFNSINMTYGNDGYDKFSAFFLQDKIKQRYKEKGKYTLEVIYKHPDLPKHMKLEKSLNCLYLSDLLKILVDIKEFHSDKRLTGWFYLNAPDDLNVLKIRKGQIIKLRNCIAHYDISKYEKNHPKFTRALIFFEVHLGCSIHKIHSLKKFDKKPSTSDILIALYTIEPRLFDKGKSDDFPYDRDRLLLDLFDDLAVINGWDYNSLPSPWTILRQKYALMKNN